mmetsp:Transcript_73543/g.170575  ORF Transcript_73543/g.170575 Transcript_73543/m.170575 type:complete len:347 (+) Transcript_73543:235-1275(+)
MKRVSRGVADRESSLRDVGCTTACAERGARAAAAPSADANGDGPGRAPLGATDAPSGRNCVSRGVGPDDVSGVAGKLGMNLLSLGVAVWLPSSLAASARARAPSSSTPVVSLKLSGSGGARSLNHLATTINGSGGLSCSNSSISSCMLLKTPFLSRYSEAEATAACMCGASNLGRQAGHAHDFSGLSSTTSAGGELPASRKPRTTAAPLLVSCTLRVLASPDFNVRLAPPSGWSRSSLKGFKPAGPASKRNFSLHASSRDTGNCRRDFHAKIDSTEPAGAPITATTSTSSTWGRQSSSLRLPGLAQPRNTSSWNCAARKPYGSSGRSRTTVRRSARINGKSRCLAA